MVQSLPEQRSFLVDIGQPKYDIRGHTVMVDFGNDKFERASVVAYAGFGAAIVLTQ